MNHHHKQNLRNLLWSSGAPKAGQPGPVAAERAEEDVLWARSMIAELSADPAIWSNPSGPDPDWALAEFQDDAGFLDDLMSGAAFLGGDDAEGSTNRPTPGPDPALDDLFADLPIPAPKPRRRPQPAQHPADPALDDIFAQTGPGIGPGIGSASDQAPTPQQALQSTLPRIGPLL